VGTLASYGVVGDTYRFYEINDDVTRFAYRYFTFLADSKACIEIVHNDARLALEDELSRGESQQFDVLIVDAFASDAVPIHLLTREAVVLYSKRLKPDGVLLFNISNRYLKLWPVIKGHGFALGMEAALLVSNSKYLGKDEAGWCVLTNNKLFLKQDDVRSLIKRSDDLPVNWTDNFASIFNVL
jgi:hypothetical protein